MILARETPTARGRSELLAATNSIPAGIVFGTAWRGEATARLAWAAFTAGFRAFDTANQPRHYNESALGEVVRMAADAGVPRAKLWLQTKFTHPSGHAAPKGPRASRSEKETPDASTAPYDVAASTEEQVRQSFSSSLEHLRTSYVDALFLHAPSGGHKLAASDWRAWRSMETLALAGQARALGVSNVNAAQLRELLAETGDAIRVRPKLVQNRCWASRNWDAEVRNLCIQHGLIYQGFSLLSRGVNGHVFTGENAHRLRQIAVEAGAGAASASSPLTAEQVSGLCI